MLLRSATGEPYQSRLALDSLQAELLTLASGEAILGPAATSCGSAK
jgi:hypothetical protein